MMTESVCPISGCDLQGKEIPEKHRAAYGGATHFDRVIGVEVQGIYDGVLYWLCPDCEGAWNRWPADDPYYARLYLQAQHYVEIVNQKRLEKNLERSTEEG